MGSVCQPPQVRLFAGLLTGDAALLPQVIRALEAEHGPADQISPIWPFTASHYYREELGDDVVRQFVFFEHLINVERLPAVKLGTNAIEQAFCDRLGRCPDRRPVNIDPGYMSLGKLVLATTKDYTHRLFLGDGIFGEVTLRFHAGRWQPWPWTYADYAGPTYHAFLLEARERLKTRLREERPAC
jgi:hypothetical protein